MIQETKKILEDENLKMAATCVRVPVVSGHSESVLYRTGKRSKRCGNQGNTNGCTRCYFAG